MHLSPVACRCCFLHLQAFCEIILLLVLKQLMYILHVSGNHFRVSNTMVWHIDRLQRITDNGIRLYNIRQQMNFGGCYPPSSLDHSNSLWNPLGGIRRRHRPRGDLFIGWRSIWNLERTKIHIWNNCVYRLRIISTDHFLIEHFYLNVTSSTVVSYMSS